MAMDFFTPFFEIPCSRHRVNLFYARIVCRRHVSTTVQSLGQLLLFTQYRWRLVYPPCVHGLTNRCCPHQELSPGGMLQALTERKLNSHAFLFLLKRYRFAIVPGSKNTCMLHHGTH